MRESVGLLAVLFFATSLHAQQQRPLAVAGDHASCIGPPFSDSYIHWIEPYAEYPGIVTIASGDGRRVLGLREGTETHVVRVEPDGTETPFFQDVTSRTTSLAVAPDGMLLLLVFGVSAVSLFILKGR